MTAESSIPTTRGGAFLLNRPSAADIFTPEDLTSEQHELASLTSRFSSREVLSKSEKIEAKEEGLVVKLLKDAGALGLLMAEVPEKFGGAGLGKISSAVISENITHQGSFSVAFLCHTGIGTLPILYYGNEEQKKRFLPKLASGEMIGAYSLTEASAGTDALSLKTKAVLSPDKKFYILNGEKHFCTNGGFADLITVFAKVDGVHVTAFLMEKGSAGLSIGKEEEKMGIEGSSTVPLSLSDVKVPVENVLGEVGKGHKIAFNVLNIGRAKLGFACTGAMKRIMENVTSYANERYQFGKPIGSFELIRQKIARLAVLTYLSESLIYRLAGLFDKKAAEKGDSLAEATEEFAIEASIAKVFCSEALGMSADEGVQIFGGYGFIKSYIVEQHYRDCRINRIFEGTNEINRMIIVEHLIKKSKDGKLNLMEKLNEILAGLKSGFSYLPSTDFLADEINSIENLKRLAIYLAFTALNKFQKDLENRQSVMAVISDLVIEVFVCESGTARALKAKEAGGKTEIYEAIIRSRIAENFPKLYTAARQALINISQGSKEIMAPQIAAFEKMSKTILADTDALNERIASHMLGKEAYSL